MSHQSAISDFKVIQNAKRITIKVGSSLLVENDKISNQKIKKMVDFISGLTQEGREIILVSSGAVAAADYSLGKSSEKRTIVESQALASIGQVNLMECYQKLFSKSGMVVAQILLSKFSIHHRPSFINLQNTVKQLLKMKVTPIINENDPVATEELRFGENDVLGALTSALVESDLYLILSNVDAFYLYHGQKKEQKLSLVDQLEPIHWEAAKKGKSSLGQGGMLSKLEAAQLASTFQIPTLITSGEREDLKKSIFEEHQGTLFYGHLNLKSRKYSTHHKWLLSYVTPKGKIVLDWGAEKAIQSGKSLLPIGITAVKGQFTGGDVCNILNQDHEVIARGRSHFSKAEIQKIMGKNLSELESILGHSAEKEVVHRNHLVII